MNLLDILNSPWAIQPEKLREINAIYSAHVRGERIDLEALEAKLGRPVRSEPKRFEVVDGVAVIPLEGVIAKRMNLFSDISGGTSSELVGRDIRDAVGDSSVHSIVLAVDSPGGTVDGTQALADQVMAAREQKPVVTFASGTMASAAYWIGSAASRAYIADSTTAVGDIGVVATHVDVSAAEEKQGIKTTEIFAGKYKRIATQHAPLSKEGRETIQDQVDYTYSLFVGAVAKQRGATEKKVLEDMADGRIFIGQQAVDAGLVDGITTLGALITDLNSQRAAARTSLEASMPITRDQLAAEAPDVLTAILAEGATAERERIQAVESALIPGHEALINSLKYDGKTDGGAAALAVLGAERSLRTQAAAHLRSDAPKPVPTVSAPIVDTVAAEDTEAPIEDRCKAKWERDQKVRSEFGTLAAYTAYSRAIEGNLVRVLGKREA
jgi:capsid assembly protease